MNQQQKKFLREQLNRAIHAHSQVIYSSAEKMPAEVKRADAIVRAWQKESQDRSRARSKAMHEAERAATEVILFKSVDEAKAAIESFAKAKF